MNRATRSATVLAAILAGAWGCASSAPDPTALAIIESKSDSKVTGKAIFTQLPSGQTRVEVTISGATPGSHGLHIHEKGDCSAPDATSAGEHFSTKPAPHAGPQDAARHTGDLGNVTADESGRVENTFTGEMISLVGATSMLERIVVVAR